MFSFHVKFVQIRQTEGEVKQHAPNLSMQGHKNSIGTNLYLHNEGSFCEQTFIMKVEATMQLLASFFILETCKLLSA